MCLYFIHVHKFQEIFGTYRRCVKSFFKHHTGEVAIENALNNRRTRIKIALNNVFECRATNDIRKLCFCLLFDLRSSIVYRPSGVNKHVQLSLSDTRDINLQHSFHTSSVGSG